MLISVKYISPVLFKYDVSQKLQGGQVERKKSFKSGTYSLNCNNWEVSGLYLVLESLSIMLTKELGLYKMMTWNNSYISNILQPGRAITIFPAKRLRLMHWFIILILSTLGPFHLLTKRTFLIKLPAWRRT